MQSKSGYSTMSHKLAPARVYKNKCGYKVRCAHSSGPPAKGRVRIVKTKASSPFFKAAGTKQFVIGKALTMDEAIAEEIRLEKLALNRAKRK